MIEKTAPAKPEPRYYPAAPARIPLLPCQSTGVLLCCTAKSRPDKEPGETKARPPSDAQDTLQTMITEEMALFYACPPVLEHPTPPVPEAPAAK